MPTLHILIVDDWEPDRKLIRLHLAKGLKDLYTFEIFEASTEQEAMDRLSLSAPDLILLDYHLALSDGISVIKKIRAMSITQPGIVFLTGSDRTDVAVEAIKNGADDYLNKHALSAEVVRRAVMAAYTQQMNLRTIEAQQKSLAIDHARKTRELEDARTIQLSMLPKTLPQNAPYTFAAAMETATEVGGDFYDLVALPDGSYLIALADATGHGYKAGIMVATLKSYFQTLAGSLPPVEIMARISAGIESLGLRGMYTGLTLLHLQTEQAHLWCAGMPPVLVYHANTKSVSTYHTPAMFLGSKLHSPPEAVTISLESEDVMLLFTDGLNENRNVDKQQWGMSGVTQYLSQHGERTAQKIVLGIQETALHWRSPQDSPLDDISLFAIKKKK